MTSTVAVSREIAAPAERVWEMISDLPRMGEWSPENTGGAWSKGATGPKLGAHFRGSNRRGWHRWSTNAVVIACERGRTFEFEVSSAGLKIARWGYLIEETDGGCRVTESFTNLEGPLLRAGGALISGVSDRATHNRATMETTLANLASAAER